MKNRTPGTEEGSDQPQMSDLARSYFADRKRKKEAFAALLQEMTEDRTNHETTKAHLRAYEDFVASPPEHRQGPCAHHGRYDLGWEQVAVWKEYKITHPDWRELLGLES